MYGPPLTDCGAQTAIQRACQRRAHIPSTVNIGRNAFKFGRIQINKGKANFEKAIAIDTVIDAYFCLYWMRLAIEIQGQGQSANASNSGRRWAKYPNSVIADVGCANLTSILSGQRKTGPRPQWPSRRRSLVISQLSSLWVLAKNID